MACHAGPDGASQLKGDTMDVLLVAGPPSRLIIEGPAHLDCGTRAMLPQLVVRVADAAGNCCTSIGLFEVGQMAQGTAMALLAVPQYLECR